jgi:YD repeat-containing protein
MATIDLDAAGALAANLLKESTTPRGSTPDGNIYFDVSTGEVQIITANELTQVNFGSGLVANPLLDAGASGGGITARALYKFERMRRAANETLRKYDKFMVGSYKFAGAYEMANGRKIATADVKKLRGTGMVWRSASGAVSRIYFGARSLGNIEATSQPFRQLTAGGAPTNFSYAGPIDEMFQVFGTTANGDAGAGNFDSRSYLAVSIRTFGKNGDRKTLADSGIPIMDGFSAGFALGESNHLTTGSYTLADVYGGSAIAPFTGMSLEKLAVAQVETGFNEGSGSFTWVLNNTGGGTLDQCTAYMDAVAQTDNDIDAGTGVTNGKRVSTWYSYDATGRIVTRSGADSNGLFIEGLAGADKLRIVSTTDAATTRTYPFFPLISIPVGASAAADPNCWYHAYFKDVGANDFNTATAVVVRDKSGAEVKGLISGATTKSFEFAYDTDTYGGTAGTDKLIVIEVEGNGGATAAKTEVLITRTQAISAPCIPGLETNL